VERVAGGLLPVDLTRSTGFHRLVVEGREYWFGTEDAKLGLDGIERMLNHLRTVYAGAGWRGQVLFSSGEVLRDPHVVYGWLDRHADVVVAVAREILAQPRWGSEAGRRMSRVGGPGVDAAATHRLLRSDPRRLLVEVEGKGYLPLRVVRKDRRASVRTAANLRLLALLRVVARLAGEVRAAAAEDEEAAARCLRWQEEVGGLLRLGVLRELGRDGVPANALHAARTADELADRRYRAMYGQADSLRRNFGWQATREPLSRFAYVDYADRIYQSFVAVALADALGCAPVDPVLGRAAGAAFSGPEFDVHVDRTPPEGVLRSWRLASSTPDRLRPDVLVHRREDGAVLLLDAKYRAHGNRATEDSRKEVLAYMASYGLETAVIAYPPRNAAYAQVAVVEGAGQRLIELPVAPRAGLRAELAAEVPKLLAHLAPGRY
ncbi:hypothetical protein, partial [Streptomyces rubellomurinus]|uniref:hypothetical protein n=1 Tax=Streptomyces rubellomurinus (strain ATCC 31215) TaxID=359131 RepID=UPI001ABF361B